jgi:ribokinase
VTAGPVVTAPRVVVVGDVCTDVVALLAGRPAAGSDRPAAIVTRGGGAGANVAAHLAALGMPVLLAGCVGDDLPGSALCRDLAAEGVTLAVRTVPGTPTGTVISLV